MSAVTVPSGDDFGIRGVRATDTGLVLSARLGREAWDELVGRLARVERSAPWWLGDALVYGEERYGATYTEIGERVGRSVQTLKNCAWVARHVLPANREPSLSWAHHRAVANEPPERQRDLLAMAVAGDMTVDELTRERHIQHAGRTASRSVDASTAAHVYRCPGCGREGSGPEWVGGAS